jgi:hypothetical protein
LKVEFWRKKNQNKKKSGTSMGNIIMSHKEREQLIVFSRLKSGEISQFEAAAQLKLSTRWTRDKLKRFCQSGAEGLVHKSRNKPSGKRYESERILAIELLKNDSKGFGPTFATEKLRELKNIKISKEALRKVMISEKLWKSKQSKSKYRKLRDRKPMLGMMVQLDGSPHDWFGEGNYLKKRNFHFAKTGTFHIALTNNHYFIHQLL